MRPEDVAEVERVMRLTDEEVKAELVKDGMDPAKIAADARAAFERIVKQISDGPGEATWGEKPAEPAT